MISCCLLYGFELKVVLLIGWLPSKAKPSLLCYLTGSDWEERRNGFKPFPRSLVQNEQNRLEGTLLSVRRCTHPIGLHNQQWKVIESTCILCHHHIHHPFCWVFWQNTTSPKSVNLPRIHVRLQVISGFSPKWKSPLKRNFQVADEIKENATKQLMIDLVLALKPFLSYQK